VISWFQAFPFQMPLVPAYAPGDDHVATEFKRSVHDIRKARPFFQLPNRRRKQFQRGGAVQVLNPVDPQLESAWLTQPLNLSREKVVSSLCFQMQLVPLQRGSIAPVEPEVEELPSSDEEEDDGPQRWGLYRLNPVDPQLESARNLTCDIIQAFAIKMQAACAATQRRRKAMKEFGELWWGPCTS
jgi:hypothetical protein